MHIVTTIPGAALLFSLMIILESPAVAEHGLIGGEKVIRWRSANQSRAEIPESLADLYTTLYNTGQLSLMSITDHEGQMIEQIMRNAEIMVGPHFPLAIDSLMCDLNPRVCSRELISASEEKLGEPASHLHGYKFTRGNWTNNPGDTILFPKVQLEEYEEFKVSWKNEGESIDQILENREVTCEAYGVDCLTAVKFLNSSNPEVLEKSYQGQIVLPTRGVTASIELSHEDEPIKRYTLQIENVRQTDLYIQQMQELDHAEDAAFEALIKNTVTEGEANFQSSLENEPYFPQQKRLFELIHHPGLDDNWIPSLDWDVGPVAVFDDWVDTSHCDIGDNITVSNLPNSAASTNNNDPDCGEVETANPIEHHGTHVVASIGASLNGKGIGGLLPADSKIQTYQIERNKLGTAKYREQLSIQIITVQLHAKPKTYNFSWSYTNNNNNDAEDLIKNAIEVLEGNALVVVAAGNEGMDFDAGNCSLLPGCFHSFSNVLTVVGLNRLDIPSLWSNSNNSGDFHIGAIAEKVFSATKNNRYGELSGTSQAAPQVSATAAYLWAITKATKPPNSVKPQHVKNRIIYTADYFPSLKDKVLGGRLNMARALDIGQIAIVKTNGDKIVGPLISFTVHNSDEPAYLVILKKGNSKIEIRFGQLKRMIRGDASTGHIVFYTPPDKFGKLVREEGLTLITLSQQLMVNTDNGIELVSLNEIADYTAQF